MQKIYKYIILILTLIITVNVASALNITTPTTNQNVTQYLNISWTPDNNISYYNLTLLNSTLNNLGVINSINVYNGLPFIPSSTIIENTLISTSASSSFTLMKTINVNDYYFSLETLMPSSTGQWIYNVTIEYNDSTTYSSSQLVTPPTSIITINPYLNKSVNNIKIYQKGSLGSGYTINITNTTVITGYNGNNYIWNTYNNNLSLGLYYINLTAYNSTNSLINYSLSPIFNITKNHLLNVTASSGGSAVSNFSLSVFDTTKNITTNYTTTNGYVGLDVIRGQSYNISIDSLNAALQYNYTTIPNTPGSTLNFALQANNSIQITITKEIGSAIITEPVTVTIQTESTLNNYSTSTGYLNVTGIAVGENILTFTSTNYSTRTYILNIVDRTSQTLNARLLNNTDSIAIGIYTKTSAFQILSDALITVQKQYSGGSYATVVQGLTDESGFITFNLQSGTNYRVIISALGYNTKQFNQQFYLVNSPYTWILYLTGEQVYSSVQNGVGYNYTPQNTTLINGLNTFAISTYNKSSIISWTAVNANGVVTNVSGSPTGGTASTIVDLTGFDGVYPVIFMFNYYDSNTQSYQTYQIPINYYTTTKTAYNNTIPETFTNLKNDIGNTGWTAVFAVFLIFAAVMTVMQLSGNSTAGIITGFAALIFFAFIGWISGLLVGFIVIISIILMYTERSY